MIVFGFSFEILLFGRVKSFVKPSQQDKIKKIELKQKQVGGYHTDTIFCQFEIINIFSCVSHKFKNIVDEGRYVVNFKMQCNVFDWTMTNKVNGLTMIDKFLTSSDKLMVHSSKSLHGFRVALKRSDEVPYSSVFIDVNHRRYHQKYKAPSSIPLSRFDWKCSNQIYGNETCSTEEDWCISGNLEYYHEDIEPFFMISDHEYNYKDPTDSQDSPCVSTQSDDFYPFGEESDDDFEDYCSSTYDYDDDGYFGERY
jgi:hypothetical protein